MQNAFQMLMTAATLVVALVWVGLLLRHWGALREGEGTRMSGRSLARPAHSASVRQPPRRHLLWSAAAGASLALYAFAVWCEAACRPAGIGHNEVLTWSRMMGALERTTWSDLEFPVWLWTSMPLEPLGVIGMVGVLAWGLLRQRPNSEGGRVVVWGYSLLLLVAGGWLALLALPFNLIGFPPDGEFLDEGIARISALGLWVIVCLCACWVVRPARSGRTSLAEAT